MRFSFLASISLCFAACSAPPTQDVQPQGINLFGPSASDYAKIVDQRFAAKDWTAKTLPELSEALSSESLTSQELTQAYLDRIATVDRAGPRLQSVLSLNPDAMSQAKASDDRRANGEALGPLDGIPILFKDNIETLDPIATTAGGYALKDNVTGRDSPLVAGLRARGAIILGKTNLSQWANFRSNESVSGWTALGGQVRNPHMLEFARPTSTASLGSSQRSASSANNT